MRRCLAHFFGDTFEVTRDFNSVRYIEPILFLHSWERAARSRPNDITRKSLILNLSGLMFSRATSIISSSEKLFEFILIKVRIVRLDWAIHSLPVDQTKCNVSTDWWLWKDPSVQFEFPLGKIPTFKSNWKVALVFGGLHNPLEIPQRRRWSQVAVKLVEETSEYVKRVATWASWWHK